MNNKNWIKYLFVLIGVASFFISPVYALFIGIIFALTFGNPLIKLSKLISKYSLQIAVVGLGFGMNLHSALAAGKDGMTFTIVSVVGVITIGVLLGRWLSIKRRLAYLISVGTAICGGSAIAATAPVVEADDDETSLSLAVIFLLNAIALFLFPPLGSLIGLDEQQFGIWSAIAIHDTSSVVGAAASYGPEALKTAVTIKLTRALWIIPVSLVSMFFFKSREDGSKGGKIYIPWFIFMFVGAMLINTFFPLPEIVNNIINIGSHRLLSLSLFLIGSTLSYSAIKKVGVKPLLLAVVLWAVITAASLAVLLEVF